MTDRISHPEHYTFSEYEPKDVIYAWHLDFYLGNVVKYIARAGRKDGTTMIEDLQKARQYIDFEIEKLKEDPEGHRGVLFTNAEHGHTPITEDDLRQTYMAEVDDGK